MKEEKSLSYMTTKEAAAKWGIQEWRVKEGCETNQIPNVARLGEQWIIPVDEEKPELKFPRTPPEPKKSEHGSDYKDIIYENTMRGFPDFNIQTHKIGNTTYIVSSSFSPSSGRTLREAAFLLDLHLFNKTLKENGYSEISVNESDAQFRKLHQEERENMPSDDERREYYYNKFVEIGFNEQEISDLMKKIDEHIATFNEAFNKRYR